MVNKSGTFLGTKNDQMLNCYKSNRRNFVLLIGDGCLWFNRSAQWRYDVVLMWPIRFRRSVQWRSLADSLVQHCHQNLDSSRCLGINNVLVGTAHETWWVWRVERLDLMKWVNIDNMYTNNVNIHIQYIYVCAHMIYSFCLALAPSRWSQWVFQTSTMYQILFWNYVVTRCN